MEKLTAENLKNELWETLSGIKSGEIDPGQADSIASQAREIIRVTGLQLKISHQTKRDVPVDVIQFSETPFTAKKSK